jgi:SAM-dependent methyltransferase
VSLVVTNRELVRRSHATPSDAIAAASGGLAGYFADARPDWHSQWAWDHYQETVLGLSQRFGLKELCEIGGGRDPLFLPGDRSVQGLSLTVNDIDQLELDFAPKGLRKARFDIAGRLDEPAARPESFDLMFSRMVFEHVDGVARAWANCHALLKPGGVALAFIPTLWAPVFTLNHLIPESLSRRIVHALFPARRDGGGDPKFPALYDQCFSAPRRIEPMLRRAGFVDVHIQPFWGHGYFERLPVAREVDALFNRAAAALDWRLVTTYAYIVARKAG